MEKFSPRPSTECELKNSFFNLFVQPDGKIGVMFTRHNPNINPPLTKCQCFTGYQCVEMYEIFLTLPAEFLVVDFATQRPDRIEEIRHKIIHAWHKQNETA